MSVAPTVSSHGISQAFGRAKGQKPHSAVPWDLSPLHMYLSWSSLQIYRFITSDCRSSCRVVVSGALSGGTACFVRP